MRTLPARPALRWLLPLAVLMVLVGSFLVAARASADPALPERSAQQLLVDLQNAQVDGLSGTVVQNADLGLPAIPGDPGSAAAKLGSLLAGSHTLQVWYSAPDKMRLALHEDFAESDVIVHGDDVWTYDSATKKATHRTLSHEGHDETRQAPADTPRTPEEAARLALQAVGATTDVTTDRTTEVAGRPAYELVLAPQDKASKITSVRIALDGAVHIPLRVQVFGSAAKPVAEVGYTSVTLEQPEARLFDWNPPEGTDVREATTPEHKAPTAAEKEELAKRKAQAERDTTVVGQGWTSVVVTQLPDGTTADADPTLKAFLDQLTPVSGAWGSGRELNTALVTAILTDDGRLAVGAVGSDLVQQALAR